MAENFKDAVALYLQLHEEITNASKQLRELRKQKETLGETILEWMKNNGIDECELCDGNGKLVRKTSRRAEGLKKEYILSELKRILLNDEIRAQQSLENMCSMRAICEKEVLTKLKR
jgi:Family of unknown function (DUF5760)